MNNNVNNFKEIYELLEKLCKNLTGGLKQKEVLSHVTRYIANNPTSLSDALPFDENSIVNKITNHISSSSSNATNDMISFLTLHEDLKSCVSIKFPIIEHEFSKRQLFMRQMVMQNQQRQRSAILTFLCYMAENRNKLMSINKLSTVESQLSSNLLYSNRQYVQKSSTTFIPAAFNKRNSADSSAQLNGSSSSDKIYKYLKNKTTNSSKPQSDAAKLSTMKSGTSIFRLDTTDSNSKLPDCTNASINDDIVQSVIYSFTGIEGNYLKKDVVTGMFKLDPKARNLNVVQAIMLLRLSKLGYYHDQVQAFADIKSGRCALGLFGQGFISALKNELTKYYGMIAMLQETLNKQRKLEFEDWHGSCKGNRVTLMKIMVWAVDPLQRLQWLSQISEACQEKKGGALASTVYEFLCNGDPMVHQLVRELLFAICGPLLHQLTHWLLEGELIDPHNEFFIECLNEIGPDRLWHEKYRIRKTMLPKFITTDMANKILITGKSINFLREICEDKTPIKGREELTQCLELNPENIFSNTADTKLHSAIDMVYLNTSKKVLDIVMGPHKLLDHLQAMRRFLLLGQGDFVGVLMETLKSELDKPAKDLYGYELSAIVDSAIRSSNAQFEDPEILNHLDVRLMDVYGCETGWDNFSLRYTVRGPLATMLEPSMNNYQVLFKPLWKMKHMEFLLSSKMWKDQKCNEKMLRSMSRLINPIMYRLNLYTSEMMHFINQMEYYILFEVIECSWAIFQDKVHQATALDDILDAHNNFLESIKIGTFLDSKTEKIISHMPEIYVGITRLEVWQDKFFEKCFKELDAVKKFKDDIKNSEKKSEYGVTAEKRLERDDERKIFEQYLLSSQKTLEKIGTDYEFAVRQFLLTLNSNSDHNLQLFGMRLDFNEYYKKRDNRLDVPLTFEHMRMSYGLHKSMNANSSNTSFKIC